MNLLPCPMCGCDDIRLDRFDATCTACQLTINSLDPTRDWNIRTDAQELAWLREREAKSKESSEQDAEKIKALLGQIDAHQTLLLDYQAELAQLRDELTRERNRGEARAAGIVELRGHLVKLLEMLMPFGSTDMLTDYQIKTCKAARQAIDGKETA